MILRVQVGFDGEVGHHDVTTFDLSLHPRYEGAQATSVIHDRYFLPSSHAHFAKVVIEAPIPVCRAITAKILQFLLGAMAGSFFDLSRYSTLTVHFSLES
mmetsp:Transcript_17359/g.23411  ORF Transcript_17359/g.23411 Transcript_17359/m.23411 type:complete len:100 (-) Transcript_17359:329-628(-)